MANIGFSEDMTHEFKSDKNRLSDNDLIDAIVAFANTEGGELYLGVENDGEISGVHPQHRDISQLAAMVANRTVPPVAVRAQILDLSLPVLRIDVPPKDAVVASSTGKMQRRRLKADGTPENVAMFPYEIGTRLSSLGLLDYTAQPVSDATPADLDPVERDRLRSVIRANRGDTSLLELDDAELDSALRLVAGQGDRAVPTLCGLLLIGRPEALQRLAPSAASAIQVLEGTDIRVNQSFLLPILSVFEKISAVFDSWNRERETENGLYRIAVPDYDRRAFREALVNAFSHRDYTRLGRVLVQMNDDGMTISSQGGFIEGITSDNLIDAVPHGRNPALADALKRIGLAERTGRGIDRIFEGSLAYGRMLPEYTLSTSENVTLFIPRGEADTAFVGMLAQAQRDMGRSFPIYSLLVLGALRRSGRLGAREITATVRGDAGRVQATLGQLVTAGFVQAQGAGANCLYSLGKRFSVAGTPPGTAGRTATRACEADQRGQVISLARQQGSIKRPEVESLLGMTSSQAYRLLTQLVAEGQLAVTGKARAVRYLPRS